MAVKFNDESFELKYLFHCQFNDGFIFHQNELDTSVRDALRSAFYDLSQDKEQHGGIKRFWLEGEGHTYLVDLRDGHFEIDGVPFSIGENTPPMERELIYFRKHEHDSVMSADPKKAVPFGQGAHRLWYFLGWQGNISGKNFQQTINVRQLKT